MHHSPYYGNLQSLMKGKGLGYGFTLFLNFSDVKIPDISVLIIFCFFLEGLDLNPVFTDFARFRPAGAGGELKLFEQAGIKLVHGWLVDPHSPEFDVVSRFKDYDSSVNLIVEADHVTKGQFVVPEDLVPSDIGGSGDASGAGPSGSSSSQAGPSSSKGEGSSNGGAQSSLTEEEKKKVEDGE